MAKLILKPKHVRLEEQQKKLAELEQERFLKVQEMNKERERKIGMLLRRKKRNKIIVMSIFFIILIVLIIFGTVNTFFKKQIEYDEINNMIANATVTYPESGLDGFIKTNFKTWFNSYLSYNRDTESELGIEYVEPDISSIAIHNIRIVNHTLARVYFSANIVTKNVDIVTKEVDKKTNQPIVKEGAKVVSRYNFYIPIEYRYNTNSSGQVVSAGYVPVGNLNIYVQNTTDNAEISNNNVFSFDGLEMMPDNKLNAARTKVTNIFTDLYAGRDTSQDFITPIPFNKNLKATFVKLNSFVFYDGTNKMGYNAHISYTLKTAEGFTFINSHYLAVRENGATWLIAGIL